MNEDMRPQNLIIFDFDGTLADTTALILWTYRSTMEREALPHGKTDDDIKATIGLPLREGFRQLYPDFSEDALDKCAQAYRQIFNENKTRLVPKLYAGVKQTLSRLHSLGIVMSVASSRSNASLNEFCETNQLTPFFSLILGADDVTHAKPNPEPVLKTLEALGSKAEETLVVGDMPVDITMGRAAGCRTVGVTYGNSTREDLHKASADYIIDTFSELSGLLSK